MANPDDNLTWGRSTVETVCPLDCPDTCQLEVTVEKGKIVAIDGSHTHAVTLEPGNYTATTLRTSLERNDETAQEALRKARAAVESIG